jgi:serine/threonine protein kinase
MNTGGGARLGRQGLVVDERYRLEELIGAGGFGEVWRATQEVEGEAVRDVALKLLVAPQRTPTGSSSGGNQGDDWLNEVRAVRNVDCSAIAPIYDVGVARGSDLAFICMLLLSGETLSDRLDRGCIPWRRALSITRDVATALRACHEVDVQHCDLKPQNIFLRHDGEVFVLDFGVARLGMTNTGGVSGTAPLPTGEQYEAGVTGTVEVTGGQLPPSIPQAVAHQVYGTPGFIAPERYSGDPPTPATDVYALGVVVYQMLAGTLPYNLPASVLEPTRDSTPETRETYRAQLHTAAVRGDIRPIDEVVKGIPPQVAALVHSMLALSPDKREADSLVERLDTVWRRPYGVPDPPYIGLESFDERRAGYIAGRDADIDQIVSKLATERTVVLVGPSGCGKSSLAIAGVAAGIDQQLVEDTDGWETIVVRPTDRDSGLRIASNASDAKPSPALGTVVIVDQLEEVLGLSADARERFGQALVAVARGTEPVMARDHYLAQDHPVRVVATVRDDLFGPVAAMPELERIPESNVYTVRGVDPNGMTDIVCAPAIDAGYTLEGAEDVVDDAQRILSADASALPMVQFALTQWWDDRDQAGKKLTRAAWESLGGIEGALAEVAQALYDGLDDGDREHMKALVVSMFRADGTRVQVAESDVAQSPRARVVLDKLIERRLVQRQVDADNESTLEVVHEALARRWPMLHTWLETDRAERELLEDASYDAERWTRAGKPAEMLWRGERLEAAERLGDKLRDASDFIADASSAAGRQRRVKRGLIAGSFVVLSGFIVVLVILFLSSNAAKKKAEQALGTAEQKTEEAKTSATEAENAKILAEDKQQEAEDALAKVKEANAATREAEGIAEDLAVQKKDIEEKLTASKEAADEADSKAREADKKAKSAQEQIEEAERKTQEAEQQMAKAQRELRKANERKQKVEAEIKDLRTEWKKLQDAMKGDVGDI